MPATQLLAVAPASNSRRIATICDSVKRVFRMGVSLPVEYAQKITVSCGPDYRGWRRLATNKLTVRLA
jgi:hypothetical protein